MCTINHRRSQHAGNTAHGSAPTEASEQGKGRLLNWVNIASAIMPVLLLFLTWIVKDRVTLRMDAERLQLEKKKTAFEISRMAPATVDQPTGADFSQPASGAKRAGSPPHGPALSGRRAGRAAMASHPGNASADRALADTLRQIELLIRFHKDAQAYRLGDALISQLTPNTLGRISASQLREAEQQYREDHFGSAARLMQDALRPLGQDE